MATPVPRVSMFFCVEVKGLRLTLPACAAVDGSSATKNMASQIRHMGSARKREHALHHPVSQHAIVIKSARHMQHDEAQKHIDQHIVDVARLMPPMRTVWRQCGQRNKAEQLDV